jgi:serine protease Do
MMPSLMTMNNMTERKTANMTSNHSTQSGRLLLLTLGAAVLIAGSTVGFALKSESKEEPKGPAIHATVDHRPLARDLKLGTSFAPVVKQVAPSVVQVFTTTKPARGANLAPPGFDDPWFRRFFGDIPDGRDGRRGFRMPPRQGVGSGVIVTKDGYILTNHHVVDGAEEVKIALQDGREFSAKVIGKDPKTDVAVVKVDATNLPAIELGDSDQIEVGDLVLAVGNPFGIGQTVTLGMVSATRRGALGLDYEDFIQTDAAINPGNSGGALVDLEGRLAGINTAILSRSGGNQGIGFAIPINLARGVMDSLVKEGKVVRGYLGVMIQDVTPALAQAFKLKDRAGALVGDIMPKSPAEKAGLESGDLVVEYDGKPIRDSRHFKLLVGQTKPGAAVPLKVMRDGAPKSIQVTVRELPDPTQTAKVDPQGGPDIGTLNGVAVADLDVRARREFQVPGTVQGALITDVDETSAASRAGLKPGDVIVEINRQPVKDAEAAVRLTGDAKEKTTLVKVWSQGRARFVVVDESHAG